jgi:hypothetical protein
MQHKTIQTHVKYNRIEDKDVIFNRIRVFLLVSWIIFTIFCVLESIAPQAKGQQSQPSYETQFLNNALDPASPSARYVLDKLNKHLSNAIADNGTQQDKMNQLTDKVDNIVGQNLGTRVAVLSEKQDTNGWILKAALGGIATLLGKEILDTIKNRKT